MYLSKVIFLYPHTSSHNQTSDALWFGLIDTIMAHN